MIKLNTPKILILVGAARSGSTLAGMMLGQSGHFTYAGELNHVWDRGLGLDHLCGCGAHFSACEHWQAAIAEAGLAEINGQSRYDAIQRLEAARHSINPLRRWIHGRAVGDEAKIRDDLRQLYSALARRTGRGWVLDGAKQPIYARLLIDVFGRENVHALHLVRDPRGVAYSAGKKRAKADTGRDGDLMVRRNPRNSALNWNKIDLSARALKGAAASYHVMRYEDLCANGPSLIEGLLADLGLGPDAALTETAEAATTHTISGNPIRMGGMPEKIEIDEAWRKSMPIRDWLTVSALCARGLMRYGYIA